MWVSRLLAFLHVLTIDLHGGMADTTEAPILVNLPGCQIPEGPLFFKEVLQFWNSSFNPTCPSQDKIGSISQDKVRKRSQPDISVIYTDLKFLSKILTLDPSVELNYRTCCYKEILRPDKLETDRFLLSNCKPTTVTDSVDTSSMEFLLVNCSRKNVTAKPGHVLDFHYNILGNNPAIQAKLNHWEAHKGDQPLSIMFVIIDSVSRTHALRSLPKTMSYLREELQFIDFKGYHCVGEPSSTNYIPMTLGLMWEDLARRRLMKGRFDDEPFVYKNFSQSQYLTMQMEDMAAYNIFNFGGRDGFINKPFDFYLRPFILSNEVLAPRKVCMNGKNVFDFMLDYTLEFFDTFPKTPKYTTTYITWPNHDYMTGTRVLEESLLKYFKTLEENGALNTTAVFVMSDHGFRFAKDYAESKYGLLERNLPMFLAKLPSQFKEKYPQEFENLVSNAERITSHLDLFKTVAHLHQLMLSTEDSGSSYGYNMEYGRSLLEEIPENRSCADAKIPERFCSCNFPLFDSTFKYEKFKKPHTG